MSALEEHDGIQVDLYRSLGEAYRGVDGFSAVWYKEGYNGGIEKASVIDRYDERVWQWISSVVDISDDHYPSFNTILEYAIPGKYEPVGYLDLLVDAMSHRIEIVHTREHKIKEGEYLVSCLDKSHYRTEVIPETTRTICIEVKSHIKSVGETVRQVQKYRSALPWCNCPYQYGRKVHGGGVHYHDVDFLIVSPDDRFRDVFQGQAIRFMTPEEVADDLEFVALAGPRKLTT